ncbi:DUF2202 domain-containing protein [Tenacibaculum adriaticum]|nr:DUF2202 domain-containing protein [Tenacibaculum adriaticum]
MKRTRLLIVVFGLILVTSFISCSKDDDNTGNNNTEITQTDKEALLFMLEEEKLARDTYSYLYGLWRIVQFSNIKSSEQSHMNAVANLLDLYNIDYTILEEGLFVNQDLQNLYNQFVIDGAIDQTKALQIGATIEDLDIVDLENNIKVTSNTAIISVFESLQCGSRNHLRSFVSAIEIFGEKYTPQYLTQEEYNSIINSSNEQCN